MTKAARCLYRSSWRTALAYHPVCYCRDHWAVVVFIFIRDVVNDILLRLHGPICHGTMVLHPWQKDGLGGLCFGNVEVKFLETTMTGSLFLPSHWLLSAGLSWRFLISSGEFWKFVRPALSKEEIKRTRGIIFWYLSFFLVAFGYFILTPFMVNFYFTLQAEWPDRNKTHLLRLPRKPHLYHRRCWNIIPVAAAGTYLIQSRVYVPVFRKYRRHALVVILIIAAIITPTTDPFSLTIVTIPSISFTKPASVAAGGEKERQEGTGMELMIW